MFVLNIDDYHNIHHRNMLSLLETHNIFHFVTILLNSNSNIMALSHCSTKGINIKLIIKNFEDFFMKQIVRNLNIHNYDGRIQNHQELKSLNNSKLVDFILHPLHSTKDYMECLYLLFEAFERLKNKYNYLDNYVIPVVTDWSEQVNIRRAITLRINKEDESAEKPYFKSIIFFFEKLYHHLFGEKKYYLINQNKLKSKDIEYRMIIDLLDTNIKLIYLSSNITAHLQSMNTEIIHSFKSKYKQEFYKHLIYQFDKEIDYEKNKLNVKETIDYIVTS
ncbi:hypothetical protein GLOIN_2v1846234 [Rhizophagus clarus]|uniref:DDE-1 domain-containing protein n=1 Tax=Rhizophagus clarus TaxID=94130 RepID=A0A8H3LFN8_9GLOM|nr:hypothetical protein GLOIN_2v1846234 [Rhizophagus clarus]